MSLDVSLTKVRSTEVFWANITHNLNDMAEAAGIYKHLWLPEEIGITHAGQLIEPLEAGLKKMKADPDKYREYDSPNGWGKYDDFVPWVERYIEACKQDPDAEVSVSR
jgi:hypothetical protein